MKIDRIVRIALLLVQVAPAAWAEPSFQAIDAEPLGAVPEKALVLHAGWQLKDSEPGVDGAAVSKVGYEAKGWFETTVPTTVLGALVQKGVYPDPYIGTNNMLIPDVSDAHNTKYDLAKYSHLPDKANPWLKPWWFRTEFQVPADYAGKTVWLNLDGINYRAEVWVNGVQIATTNELVGMFRRFRLDITAAAKPGARNALAVLVYGLDRPGSPLPEPLGGFNATDGYLGAGDNEVLKNVTRPCAVGWWGWQRAARDRGMGIWQHVWLEATGPVAVRDAAAFPEVTAPDSAQAPVTVRAFLAPSGKAEQSVEVVARLTPDGFEGATVEVRKSVRLKPGTETEVTLAPAEFPSLVYKQPRLWWPVTYGAQPLYRLSVEAWTDGKLSSKASSLFGMRSVGTTLLPAGGRVWVVNGRIIRMTGGHVVADFMMSWSAQRYRDEVRMLAHDNHTIVRVNGSGIMMPEAFFDACDRQGVLIWHDMARSSPRGGVPDEVAPIYLANMEDCIRRMRGHASMLVYCGCNEVVTGENIGVPLQNELLPRLDPGRPWIVSSGSDAPWAREKIATASFGPYGQIPLWRYFQFYRDGGGFTSKNEIGLASPPPLNSVSRCIPDLAEPDPETRPFNRTTGYHDAMGSFMRPSDQAIRIDIGTPATMAEYLAMADLYNGACYRAIFEGANAGRPKNSGTHLWKVNAAWPGFQWQIYDWYLRPNAGYYGMRSACKPLHVQASLNDFTVQVASTLPAPKPGLKVRITVVGLDGTKEAEETRVADVPADATLHLGRLPGVVTNGRMHVLALDLLDAEGRELDRTVTWLQKDECWQDLLKLPSADVRAEVVHSEVRDGETTHRIRVENKSSCPALQVWLEVLKGSLGQEVLPSFWSENALTLLPGERREVSVSYRTSLIGSAKPFLAVGGWNAMPRETDVGSGRATPMTLAVGKPSMDEAHTLTFTAEQRSEKGTRYQTWAVPVWMDGQLLRYVRVGLRGGEKQSVSCSLFPLPAGRHTFSIGEAKEPTVVAEIPAPVWTIGAKDGTPHDLCYQGGAGLKAVAGARFTVGVSDPAKDWPAIQPGRKNKEAGDAARVNMVNFQVDAAGDGAGACVVFKLMDADRMSAESLNVELNGTKRALHVFGNRCKGSLDKPEKSTPFRQLIVFPKGTLKAGNNVLKIESLVGSWIMYDGLELHRL
jgi:exo-1,4-beta-D-glucosaminidase